MKSTNRMFKVLLAGAIVAGTLAMPAIAQGNSGNGNSGNRGNQGAGLLTYLGSLPVEQVSIDESAGLVFTREEEKLARDVYTALGAQWKLRIFVNIAKSEQMHMDAVKLMLDRYQIDDPAAALNAGSFRDARLQQLYAALVAKGSLSIIDALEVGAEIEDLDLHDVTALIAGSDNQDLDTLYQNLAKGSRNHLRAFVDALAMQSVVYTPRYLDQATFDAVVAADPERGVIYDAAGVAVAVGTHVCDGTGSGNGAGNGSTGGNGTGTGTCDGSGTGTGTGTCDGSGAGSSGSSGNGNQGGGRP